LKPKLLWTCTMHLVSDEAVYMVVLCRRLFDLNLGGTLAPELGNLIRLEYL
jgi:hypothetical protein